MRKLIINAACGMALGAICALNGLPFTEVPFWLLLACLVVTQVNSQID